MYGFQDPSSGFIVRKLLTALSRKANSVDSRLPITLPILHNLIDALPFVTNSRYLQCLLSTMYLTMFYGFLRISEVSVNANNAQAVLQVTDCTISTKVRDSTVTITLSKFKHNSSKKPFHITITATADRYCPVRSMKDYLHLRGTESGPLFCISSNVPVSRNVFDSHFKACIVFIGLSTNRYTSHSFRIGAATHASANNISDDAIQKMGRWKTNAFKRYIRIPHFKSTN